MAQLPDFLFPDGTLSLADVNVAGVNKAMGTEFASYYGFDVSGTIAFGDGGNDISMILCSRDGNSYGRSFRGCEKRCWII